MWRWIRGKLNLPWFEQEALLGLEIASRIETRLKEIDNTLVNTARANGNRELQYERLCMDIADVQNAAASITSAIKSSQLAISAAITETAKCGGISVEAANILYKAIVDCTAACNKKPEQLCAQDLKNTGEYCRATIIACNRLDTELKKHRHKKPTKKATPKRKRK